MNKMEGIPILKPKEIREFIDPKEAARKALRKYEFLLKTLIEKEIITHDEIDKMRENIEDRVETSH